MQTKIQKRKFNNVNVVGDKKIRTSEHRHVINMKQRALQVRHKICGNIKMHLTRSVMA